MCLYPKLIKNPKYRINKKNKGNIPTCIDSRLEYVSVGCGKCIECRNQKKRNWQIRLHEEIKINTQAKFLTLTFTNKSLEDLCNEINEKESNAIATIAFRRFLERWRKKYKKSVKHWMITELGHEGTERIHLHGILFTNIDNKTIENLWSYGQIWIGDYVNAKTINYIVKYVTKIDELHKGFEGKILCSKGIGSNYINKHNLNLNKYKYNETNEYYKLPNGFDVPLPIYYRNKIYTETEKEYLWLEKLNKNIKYINGVKYKVDTEQNIQIYENALKHAQRNNKIIGYGDDSDEFKKNNYNVSLRDINISKKIKKYNDLSKKRITITDNLIKKKGGDTNKQLKLKFNN